MLITHDRSLIELVARPVVAGCRWSYQTVRGAPRPLPAPAKQRVELGAAHRDRAAVRQRDENARCIHRGPAASWFSHPKPARQFGVQSCRP